MSNINLCCSISLYLLSIMWPKVWRHSCPFTSVHFWSEAVGASPIMQTNKGICTMIFFCCFVSKSWTGLQNFDLNTFKDDQIDASSHCQTLLLDLTDALVAEWEQILTAMFSKSGAKAWKQKSGHSRLHVKQTHVSVHSPLAMWCTSLSWLRPCQMCCCSAGLHQASFLCNSPRMQMKQTKY